MGNKASSGIKAYKNLNVAKKLKPKANYPADKYKLSGLSKLKFNDIATYQRQVEKELEKQAKNPKPAPIKLKTSFGEDHLNKMSSEEKARRIAEANKIIQDKELSERMAKIGNFDNIKSENVDMGINVPDANILSKLDLNSEKYQDEKDKNTKYISHHTTYGGRIPVKQVINILSNYHSSDECTHEVVADKMKMSLQDVENITQYYGLIGEENLHFLVPEFTRWSDKHQKLFSGVDLDENSSFEDLVESSKYDKPLIGKDDLKKLFNRHKQGFLSPEEVEDWNRKYWIHEDLVKQLKERPKEIKGPLKFSPEIEAPSKEGPIYDLATSQIQVNRLQQLKKVQDQLELLNNPKKTESSDVAVAEPEKYLSPDAKIEQTMKQVFKEEMIDIGIKDTIYKPKKKRKEIEYKSKMGDDPRKFS